MEGSSGGHADEDVRVVLVDDSEVLLETMVAMLGLHSGVEVVATAGDGAGALAAVAAHRPDVVLLDLRLGSTSGLQLVPALRSGAEPPAVVVFSAATDDVTRDAVQRAGAQGQLAKGGPVDEVVVAIRAAAAERRRGAGAQS